MNNRKNEHIVDIDRLPTIQFVDENNEPIEDDKYWQEYIQKVKEFFGQQVAPIHGGVEDRVK